MFLIIKKYKSISDYEQWGEYYCYSINNVFFFFFFFAGETKSKKVCLPFVFVWEALKNEVCIVIIDYFLSSSFHTPYERN